VGRTSAAFGFTTNSWCSVPYRSATARACGSSLKPSSSKPIENVFTFVNSDMSATISDESTPPERNAPSGTSLMRRRFTAALSRLSASTTASAIVISRRGRHSGRQ
jgi:hypothetical protein